MLWAKHSWPTQLSQKCAASFTAIRCTGASGLWSGARHAARPDPGKDEGKLYLPYYQTTAQAKALLLPSFSTLCMLNRRKSSHSQENHWLCTAYEQKVCVLVRRCSPAFTARRLLASGFYSSCFYLFCKTYFPHQISQDQILIRNSTLMCSPKQSHDSCVCTCLPEHELCGEAAIVRHKEIIVFN